MAVISTKNPSSLKMKYYCGKDDNQKNIIRSNTYSSLKPEATSDDVYAVGTALVSLQKHSIIDIIKLDNTVISE